MSCQIHPSAIFERVITRARIAVLEALLPEDTLRRTRTRLAGCDRMGIETVLALDPCGQHLPFSATKPERLSVATFDLAEGLRRFDRAAIESLLG
jgi:hypothetical protein